MMGQLMLAACLTLLLSSFLPGPWTIGLALVAPVVGASVPLVVVALNRTRHRQ